MNAKVAFSIQNRASRCCIPTHLLYLYRQHELAQSLQLYFCTAVFCGYSCIVYSCRSQTCNILAIEIARFQCTTATVLLLLLLRYCYLYSEMYYRPYYYYYYDIAVRFILLKYS